MTANLRTCAWLTVWLLLTGIALSTTITTVEYAIDADPGFGHGIPVSVSVPDTQVTVNFTVPLTGLADGIHRLFLHVRDSDGNWSYMDPFNKLFLVMTLDTSSAAGPTPNAIAGVEYYFDSDPGFGMGTFVPRTNPATDTLINFVAPLTGLSPGIHRIYIRVRDTRGQWSIADSYSRLFVIWEDSSQSVPAGNITRIEYFIDSDPGIGNGTALPVTPGQQVTVGFMANLNGIATGSHQLYLRAQDSYGRWGVRERLPFVVGSNNPPMLVRALGDTALVQAAGTFPLANLDSLFTDFDLATGDHLHYTVGSLGGTVAPSLIGSTLQVTPITASYGKTAIYLIATDDAGLVCRDTVVISNLPAQSAGPFTGGYSYRTSQPSGGANYSWIDISQTGTQLPLSGDEASASFARGGFAFPFYSAWMNDSLTVSTNGVISFGARGPTGYTNLTLPSNSLHPLALCLLWDDLILNTGDKVVYRNMGDGRFVVSFYCHAYASGSSPIEMQAILYSNGRIKYQYKSMPDFSYVSATVGLQGAPTGTNFVLYGSFNTRPLAGTAIEFTPSLPFIATSTTAVDFGSFNLGSHADRDVWIRNPGTATLSVTGATLPAAVTLVTTMPLTIAAGDSAALTLRWTPLMGGTLTGVATILSDAFSGNPLQFSLTGTCINLPPAIPANLTAVRSGNDVVLNWSVAANVDGYRVYRSATGYFTPPASGTLIATVSGQNVTTYTDLNALPNGRYYYSVTGIRAE